VKWQMPRDGAIIFGDLIGRLGVLPSPIPLGGVSGLIADMLRPPFFDPKATSAARPTLDALYAGFVPVKELVLAAKITSTLDYGFRAPSLRSSPGMTLGGRNT